MAEGLMTESYTVDEDITVIKIGGRLDGAGAEEFRKEVETLIDDGKIKLIIDCARLGYISSYGIGILVALQSRLVKRGGQVKLAAIQGVVADVLKVVKLGRLLDMYGDTEFARQSFYED